MRVKGFMCRLSAPGQHILVKRWIPRPASQGRVLRMNICQCRAEIVHRQGGSGNARCGCKRWPRLECPLHRLAAGRTRLPGPVRRMRSGRVPGGQAWVRLLLRSPRARVHELFVWSGRN